jgi:CO dehydrogenase/acetyl-CoA synthase alpha subunit
MEYVKLILQFLTSFFQNSTQKKKEELKLADTTETAVIETIRATTNAKAVTQQQEVQNVIAEVAKKQAVERAEVKAKPDDDKQFGSEW